MIAAKRQEIEETLRRRIADRTYPPGIQLPAEPALAAEFGVARETLRGALKQLELDGILERMPRRGTRVRRSTADTEIRQIYFLVPCPDYFIKSGYSTRQNLTNQLSGCLAAAHELHAQIVTLPLSMVNTQEDIAWDRLECLRADSRVVFTGNWFSPIYPLLRSLRCRVAHIHGLEFAGSSFEPFVRCFHQLQFDNAKRYRDQIYRFHARGCRRIAIIQSYLNDPINRTRAHYCKAVAEQGLPEIIHVLDDCFTEAQLRQAIAECHRQSGFDALIVSCPENLHADFARSFNANFNLPETVQIVTSERQSDNLRFSPPLDFLSAPHRKAGELAVRLLLQDEFTPGKTILS